ncbi:MAG: chromosomal replication initiator DnaA [Hyphomicrobiaceae bacterium]|nr:chromosomal replication initiator DnaA [Hyphomicrobiaceae bacterium]
MPSSISTHFCSHHLGEDAVHGGAVLNAVADVYVPDGSVVVLQREVIEQTVAQVFGVEDQDLRRATRGQARVARARQVAMYLAHVACGMSLTAVGRTFSRDRTTVSHACGVIEDGRDDPVFDRVLELLENVVQAQIGSYRGGRAMVEGWGASCQ